MSMLIKMTGHQNKPPPVNTNEEEGQHGDDEEDELQASVGLAHELPQHVELCHVVHHCEWCHNDEAEDVRDAEDDDEEVDGLAGESLGGEDGEGEEDVANEAKGHNDPRRDDFCKEGNICVDIPAHFSGVIDVLRYKRAIVVLGKEAIVAHVGSKVAELLFRLLLVSYLRIPVRQYSSADTREQRVLCNLNNTDCTVGRVGQEQKKCDLIPKSSSWNWWEDNRAVYAIFFLCNHLETNTLPASCWWRQPFDQHHPKLTAPDIKTS